MKLEVIPLKVFKEHKLFEMYLKVTSGEDIFFDFEYLVANDNHENGNTLVALFHDQGKILISYAFVRRPFRYQSQIFYDLITPYEYGGILIHSKNQNGLKRFNIAIEDYCKENNIVAGFQRIDPMINLQIEHYKEEFDISLVNQNIYVDLKNSEETIFSDFHKNNRRDVRYALRNGVNIKPYKPSKESMNIFYEIYKDTMDGKGADQFYYFNKKYFRQLENFSSDKLSVFIAYTKDEEPFSAALIFKKGKYSHYHLSGTNRAFTKLCGTNLLLYNAIIKMKSEGRTYFHLGGAAKSQEGLYRFKKKFSKKTIPYYVAKRVFNNYLYNQINQDLLKEGKLTQEDKNSNFFPLYRKTIKI